MSKSNYQFRVYSSLKLYFCITFWNKYSHRMLTSYFKVYFSKDTCESMPKAIKILLLNVEVFENTLEVFSWKVNHAKLILVFQQPNFFQFSPLGMISMKIFEFWISIFLVQIIMINFSIKYSAPKATTIVEFFSVDNVIN